MAQNVLPPDWEAVLNDTLEEGEDEAQPLPLEVPLSEPLEDPQAINRIVIPAPPGDEQEQVAYLLAYIMDPQSPRKNTALIKNYAEFSKTERLHMVIIYVMERMSDANAPFLVASQVAEVSILYCVFDGVPWTDLAFRANPWRLELPAEYMQRRTQGWPLRAAPFLGPPPSLNTVEFAGQSFEVRDRKLFSGGQQLGLEDCIRIIIGFLLPPVQVGAPIKWSDWALNAAGVSPKIMECASFTKWIVSKAFSLDDALAFDRNLLSGRTSQYLAGLLESSKWIQRMFPEASAGARAALQANALVGYITGRLLQAANHITLNPIKSLALSGISWYVYYMTIGSGATRQQILDAIMEPDRMYRPPPFPTTGRERAWQALYQGPDDDFVLERMHRAYDANAVTNL